MADSNDNAHQKMYPSPAESRGQVFTEKPYIMAKASSSKSKSLVIVESYGEGHQFLSVFVIDDLITESKKGAGFIHPFRSLDPYPYGFADIRWMTDDSIQFRAHSDMSQFDRETRRGKVALDDAIDLERTWTWRLQKDAFEMTGSLPTDRPDSE